MNVGLTHSRHALLGLARRLEELGHSVQWQTLVETRTIDDEDTHSEAARLLSCDWLVFPSRSAVRAWVQLGLPWSAGPGKQAALGMTSAPIIAAVGRGTAAELRAAGSHARLVGDGDAESTARVLLEMTRPGESIGLVQGDRARSTLSDLLGRGGRKVSAATVYRVETTAWQGPPAQVTVLASPSAAEAFGATLLARTVPVAIGPVTAAAVRGLGSQPIVATAPYAREVAQAVTRATSQEVLAS